MILKFRLQNTEQTVCLSAFHMKDFANKPTLVLPEWATQDMFTVLKCYLQDKLCPDLQFAQPHKLLWLSQYLQLVPDNSTQDKFADYIIKRYIVPSISIDNCLTYLTEAYKKLNSRQDDSLASWYQMLNLSMNTAAKHIENLFTDKNEQLNRIEQKIMQQIIERSFKFRKGRCQRQAIIGVMRSLKAYQYFTLPDILSQRRRMITEKRVYHENSANIIKTINLKNQKAEKETSGFALNDFMWKLVTRRKQDNLQIFLKLLDRIQPQITHQIVSIYYHTKVQKFSSQKHYSKGNLIIGMEPQVRVAEFSIATFKSLQKQRIQFSMFVSIDYTSSAILNYIASVSQLFITAQLAPKYTIQDIKTLFKKLKGQVPPLELLKFVIAFSAERIVDDQSIGVLQGMIDWQLVPTRQLKAILSEDKISLTIAIRQMIDQVIKSRSQTVLQSSDILNRKSELPPSLTAPLSHHYTHSYSHSVCSSLKPSILREASVGKSPTQPPIKCSVSKITRQHMDIMQRIDIKNFIRSNRQDMLAEFKGNIRSDQ